MKNKDDLGDEKGYIGLISICFIYYLLSWLVDRLFSCAGLSSYSFVAHSCVSSSHFSVESADSYTLLQHFIVIQSAQCFLSSKTYILHPFIFT